MGESHKAKGFAKFNVACKWKHVGMGSKSGGLFSPPSDLAAAVLKHKKHFGIKCLGDFKKGYNRRN